MKTESDANASTTPAAPAASTGSSSATPPVVTTTPTPTFTTTQWTNTQIPIDPALQQQSQAATAYQHYQGYASHYPQATYPTHYQAYAPPVTAQQSNQRQTTSTPAGNATPSIASNNVDMSDITTLNDALGSAGVDLRAEEESLQRNHDQHQPFRVYDDRSRKQPPTPSFDLRFLGQTMRTVGSSHKISRIPDDSINYLALALRARLQDLITAMITAAQHRTSTQFDRPASLYSDNQPMWSIVVRSDVAKQLAAIEKAEREEETRIRRERKERADLAAAHAAALAAQANAAGAQLGTGADDEEGGAKKKRKKEGPGVTARNMSEDVRKKMSNAVATQAAGLGGRYAWMNAANLNMPIPSKSKPAVSSMTNTTTGATTVATIATTANTSMTLNSSWATPYIPTKPKTAPPPQEEDTRLAITMRDAVFVIEKERGHGGGKGSARGWV